MSKARNLSLLSTVEAGATTDQTKADLNAIGVSGGRKNLIINGAMQVAQRGTSLTGLHNNTNYLIDRFSFGGATSSVRLTMSQDSDGPAGFANSLKLDCTTADTSIAAGDEHYFQYRVEGQDLQRLKKGTSSAESMTLSFYVKGNAAATYTAEFYDADNNRQNGQTFNVTTSWNRVTLTYAPDTTGAYTDDNTIGVYIVFWINAGSNHTSGTFTSNTWAASVTANRVSSSNTSFFDSTARTLNITGVQLEVGSTATDFEHRSYGEELALCQRYFQKVASGADTAASTLGIGAMYTSAQLHVVIDLAVTMRVKPSVTIASGSGYYIMYRAASSDSHDDYIYDSGSSASNRIELYNNTDIGGSAGHAGMVRCNNTNALITADAEL